MRWNGWKRLAASVIVCGLASPAWAQKPSEARIEELIRVAAERANAQNAPGGPAPMAGQAQGAPPVVALTLDEAIKLALDRNLDIAVQRLNPQTFDYSVASYRAFYKPTITSLLSRQSTVNPSTQTIAGAGAGTGISTDTNTYNGGLTQNVQWGGGAFSATINNNKQVTNSTISLFDPAYNTNWAAQYTQPLLRNRIIDSNRRSLFVTKLNQDVSELQLQASIINTLSNVRNAYWDFVFSIQAVEVARASVALADQLVKDNQTRVDIGTMAPIDVVQAQSQAATARQSLAQAEGTRRVAELALKRLIVNGTQDPNWTASLNPVDRPEFRPEPIDVPAAVRKALEARTDLAQARKSVQANDLTLKYLHDQGTPQADLIARYGLVGQGGTSFVRSGTGVTGNITSTIPGGYTDALSSMFNKSYPAWTVALNVSYPLGHNTNQALFARARVQQTQVEAQLHQIELQVATDVTNAAVQVQSNVESVQAAQAARAFAQRTLDAEQSKFQVGMSTNYFVVQAQRDLATAQNNELQAILAYRKSLVEFERLEQTTLQALSVTIAGN